MLAAVTVISLLVAALAVFLVRHSPLLRGLIFLVYLVWHLPLILSLTFPYSTPFQQAAEIGYIVGLLAATHLIVLGGVFAWLLFPTRGVADAGGFAEPPPKLYMAIAYAAPALEIVSAISRGVSLSIDLAGNREAVSSSANIFSQLGGVASGFALYLLLFAITSKGDSIRLQPKYIAPALMIGLTVLLTGNRQFVFMSAVLVCLIWIGARQPSLRTLIWRGVPWVLIFGSLLIGFGILRQSTTEGRQDLFLQSLLATEITDHNSFLVQNYTTRSVSLYLYTYYSPQYTLAAAIMDRMEPGDVPLTSMTAPIVYRRFEDLPGLLTQVEERNTIDLRLEGAFGIFPKVWSTMYTQVYYEMGISGIVGFVVALTVVHFALAASYLRKGEQRPLRNLLVFYCFMIFGIQYIATVEPFFVGLLAAVLLRRVAETRVVW